MGCFDTLIVKCPFCDKDVEEQTKAGDCALQEYRFEDPDLPTWVMQSFNFMEWECYNCDHRFNTLFDFEVVVKDRRIELVDNLDYLELKDKEKNG